MGDGKHISGVVIYGVSSGEATAIRGELKKLEEFVKFDDNRFFEASATATTIGCGILASSIDRRIAAKIGYSDALGCAVGVKFDFGDFDLVQTVYDFDKSLPAGPVKIKFSSSEIACMREKKVLLADISEEEASKFSSNKMVKLREEVAMKFSCSIVQKRFRDWQWEEVADNDNDTKLLCRKDEETNELIPCEGAMVQLEVDSNSMIVKKVYEVSELSWK